MKKELIKRAFITIIVFATVLSGCGIGMQIDETLSSQAEESFDYSKFDNKLPSLNPDDYFEIEDYQIVAQNEYLQLYYSSYNSSLSRTESAIALRDRKSGHIWHSTVTDAKLSPQDKELTTKTLRDSMRSLLILYYTELNLNDINISMDSIMSLDPEIKTAAIDDGLQILYIIEDIGVNIVLQIEIKEDTLVINVPYQEIIEEIGSKEWLESKKEPIKSFLNSIDNMVDVIGSDKQLKNSNIKRSLNEINRTVRQLDNLFTTIDSVVGINAVSDTANRFYIELTSLISGGVGKIGLNQLLESDTKIAEESKNEYQSLIKDINKEFRLVKIINAQLKTYRAARLTGFDVLPFFGSANDNDEGYMFYPDGSGAISYFKKDRPAIWNEYFSAEVYSESFERRTVDIDWERIRDRVLVGRAFLPVYGIKENENAFVAAVTKGESVSSIQFHPSGHLINIYRAYAGFKIRNVIESSVNGFTGTRFENAVIPSDYELTIMILENDQANYSGMANRYRRYLLENNLISKSGFISTHRQVTIDILMGISQKRLMFNNFISMTTFSQAETMLDYFYDNGVRDLLINLHGWTRDGYDVYPSDGKASSDLGGTVGLEYLIEKANNYGYKIYLQDNYIEIYSGVSNVSTRKKAMGSDERIHQNSGLNINLFSPAIASDYFIDNNSEKNSLYGSHGTMFERIGTFVYVDYQKNIKYQKYNTIEFFQKMLEHASENMGGAGVVGGNAYTFPYADWIMNVPIGSTMYLYSDEEIPFYQMVIHGLIPFSTGIYNQYNNTKYQKLKMIEYAANPFFRLTYLPTVELLDTGYDSLFSSEFDDWKDLVVSVNKEMIEKLPRFSDNYIIEHKRVQDNLIVITHKDKSKVILNYSGKEIVYNGHTIKAMDYIVVKGE